MSAFEVYVEERVTVVQRRVVKRTDNWREAHRLAIESGHRLRVSGIHPTHAIQNSHCIQCNLPENGCYGLSAPCGFDFAGRSLYETVMTSDLLDLQGQR